jgi:hypothetical protein
MIEEVVATLVGTDSLVVVETAERRASSASTALRFKSSGGRTSPIENGSFTRPRSQV